MSVEDREADAYFRRQLGIARDALVAPISTERPEGMPAAEDAERYRKIRIARQEEDASLPLGAWERELKRADWQVAGDLAAEGLATRGKDLQLAAWLFEAMIARTGFAAVAPCLRLVSALVDTYGERLHPQDPEHRVNLLAWIGQKLLPPLRRVVLTATGGGREYAWNDWEQAHRNEQLRASLGKQRESEIEGASLEDVGAALASTPQETIAALLAQIVAGLTALEALEGTIDAAYGPDAPGFVAMGELLERIEVVLLAESRRRGLDPTGAPPAETHEDEASADEDEDDAAADARPGTTDRREVYAALAQIAGMLERIEPHSPVPYLIRRAVAWGGLNTAQLYNEVFVRCGGQINIFELLGLNDPVGGQGRPTAG